LFSVESDKTSKLYYICIIAMGITVIRVAIIKMLVL